LLGIRLKEILLAYLAKIEAEWERERSGEQLGEEKTRWLNIIAVSDG
jgi:hypothetical protein